MKKSKPVPVAPATVLPEPKPASEPKEIKLHVKAYNPRTEKRDKFSVKVTPSQLLAPFSDVVRAIRNNKFPSSDWSLKIRIPIGV